jgi:phosphomannomutase/phosphoglucomutase
MVEIKREVFRAYDIRGVVGRDFDPEWVERLGRALGTYFLSRGFARVVVGRDCRQSSPEYQSRLVAGLAATGCDVAVIGLTSTPVFYFAVRRLAFPAGVMVTASHNPPEFNGFKIWGGECVLTPEEIGDVHRIMVAGQFADGRGLVSEHDILPTYLEEVAAGVRLERPVRIVVDGGNGAGGEITARLLERAGAEVVRLFCTPDGTFPNHHPDPVVEKNVRELAAEVVRRKAEAGVGLDGDADRIGAVDETGRLLFGDQLLAIFARDVLAANPGAVVLGDVKCSHLLFRDVERLGGRPVMAVTGHSIMKAKVRELSAALAGEMSGHVFFADRYFGFDDASYAALRLAEILSKSERPLSRLLEDWPATCCTPELRIDCPEEAKFAVAAKALEHFRKDFEVIDIDGARIVFPDGWALIRASNTQPVLVLRFEAESAARLAEIRRLVEEPLKKWIEQAAGRV